MRAVAVLEPGKVGVVDVPMPIYGDYECLVQVKASGVCSSTDLMIIQNTHPESPEHPFRYPTILGHEAAGEIVKVGSKVRNLKVGDRVVSPMAGRYIPECGYTMSYGGMSEFAVAPDLRAMYEDKVDSPLTSRVVEEQDFLCKVFPHDISFPEATLILSFKENYSALRNFGVQEGMNILIYGDGAIGMGLSMFARKFHPGSVVVVGHHDDRLERIRKTSKPDQLINSKKEDPMEILKDKKFDIAIDAAGNLDIARQAAKMLKPGGKVCVLGVLKKGKSMLDLYDIPNYTAVQILSFPYREHRTHDDIIRFMKTDFHANDFISHVVPVEEVADAVRLLEKREAFKVVLTF